MQPAHFEIPACPQAALRRLQAELGVSDPLAQVLVRRGLEDPARARAFLDADEEHPPSAFAGIEGVVALILRHVGSGERITVHGDYDVDGVCSTAVLVRALRELGADVDSYLPDRASDGYGLNERTVARLAARGTRLLVTVDCAITATAAVERARVLGMEVVVTDHHALPDARELPRAAIVHPAACGYPCEQLCATAVAYKLAQALLEAAGLGRRLADRDLDLVALATLADVVPLVGENRTLVRRGLRALAATSKPGLQALMTVAGVDAHAVGERAVSFALAPRLNAAGRLYRADAALELILTDDPRRAEQVAQELQRANLERRLVERRIQHEAEAQIATLSGRGASPRAAYVLAGEGWHAGVIGIVASRIVERHHRPVVMIALQDGSGRGSGRSVDRFDLLAALRACEGHLVRYGGHRAAAGLEIERDRVANFAKALCEHAEQTSSPEEMVPVERVDAVVGVDQLGMGLAEELQSLAPFGRGNPVVSLLIDGAVFRDGRPMGEGKHVRFTVESRGARARAVAFGTGGRLPVEDGVPAEATFTLEVNEWRGVTEPRLVLRQVRTARQPATAAQVPAALGARDEDELLSLPDEAGKPGEQDGELVLFAMP